MTRPLGEGNGSGKLRVMSDGRLRAALWIAAAASVALSVALARQSLVVGLVSGKAVCGYVQGFSAQVLIVFLPLMNTVTPVIVLACAVVLMRWLRTGRAWLAAALLRQASAAVGDGRGA